MQTYHHDPTNSIPHFGSNDAETYGDCHNWRLGTQQSMSVRNRVEAQSKIVIPRTRPSQFLSPHHPGGCIILIALVGILALVSVKTPRTPLKMVHRMHKSNITVFSASRGCEGVYWLSQTQKYLPGESDPVLNFLKVIRRFSARNLIESGTFVRKIVLHVRGIGVRHKHLRKAHE